MPFSAAPIVLALLCAVLVAGCSRAQGPAATAPLPERLSATGLYADALARQVDPAHIAFTPQYPLWSDGARKRRWLSLPEGGAIDASDPDAWQFPVGTRLWKEFSHGNRPVETRYIERLADGSWRYASYVWNEDGSEALLAPEQGAMLAVPGAPDGRYEVPARGDCLACHDGAASPVLGVGALQLSPERDPLAPHAEAQGPLDADLRTLAARGLLENLPPALLSTAPRVAARSAEERAALGYLHGNCGHCHNRGTGVATGVPVALTLQQSVRPVGGKPPAADALLTVAARYRHGGAAAPAKGRDASRHAGVIVPGDADASLLLQRTQSRNPYTQMPPLATRVADQDGVALLRSWINHLEPSEELP